MVPTSADRLKRRAVVYRIEGKDGRTYRCRMGEDHPGAKMSNETVEAIRQAHENGEGGYRKLARRFGVPPVTVRDVVTYRRRIRG